VTEAGSALGEIGNVGSPERAQEDLLRLMARYETPLSAYLSLLLRQAELTQDCLQETFLRAYQQLYRGRAVNVRWLYTVARNCAIDELRHRSRVQYDFDPPDSVAAGGGESPHLLVALLSQLTAADRELLYLVDVDDLDAATIGSMLGIRPGAVRARVFRAREKLRVMYGSLEGDR